MTARELLELSANATGHKWKWVACNTPGFPEVPGMLLFDHAHEVDYWPRWNPLTNDGDALRLAVKLRMSVDCDDYGNTVGVFTQAGERTVSICLRDTDPYAAACRAIVIAAAEIGKEMK